MGRPCRDTSGRRREGCARSRWCRRGRTAGSRGDAGQGLAGPDDHLAERGVDVAPAPHHHHRVFRPALRAVLSWLHSAWESVAVDIGVDHEGSGGEARDHPHAVGEFVGEGHPGWVRRVRRPAKPGRRTAPAARRGPGRPAGARSRSASGSTRRRAPRGDLPPRPSRERPAGSVHSAPEQLGPDPQQVELAEGLDVDQAGKMPMAVHPLDLDPAAAGDRDVHVLAGRAGAAADLARQRVVRAISPAPAWSSRGVSISGSVTTSVSGIPSRSVRKVTRWPMSEISRQASSSSESCRCAVRGPRPARAPGRGPLPPGPSWPSAGSRWGSSRRGTACA